jgi:non-specific serine/threonine protein kinase
VGVEAADLGLTSFVGRREELARLRSILSSGRMVTICGPGGAGKTRLAEELAFGLSRSLDGSIATAYLATAGSADDVIEVVANAVGLRHLGTRPLAAELAAYIGTRRLLLLLDNCEQVADAVAELATGLLRACPRLLVVATGRRPLHVPGEQLFPIGGLRGDHAIDLFADRARLASPGLPIDEARGTVDRICARLDGMPLAIELAAAQTRWLGLADLARRLDEHIGDLSSSSTVGPERQRTLRTTLDWSWALLGDGHRALFRRLGVFSGGFTLRGAEAVASMPPLTPSGVAGLLRDLVDQSLVVFDPSASRYRLLEVVREYAVEHLIESGEQTVIAERHRHFMVGLAADVDARWFGPDQAALLDLLEPESGNLRVALEQCETSGVWADGLRLANGAFWHWLTRASLEEGVRWYGRIVGRSGDPALEARAHWRAAYLSTIRLDFATANTFLDAADDFATRDDDPLDRACATATRGLLTLYEHPELAERARQLCRHAAEDPASDAMARQWGLVGQGLASLALDDLDACREACQGAVDMARGAGEAWARELALRFLAQAEWRAGQFDTAEAALRECIAIDRDLGDLWHLGWAAEALGWIAVDTGRAERGAQLLGIASGVWARTGLSLGYPFGAWHERALANLRTRLGTRRLEAELGRGRSLGRDDAVALALSGATPSTNAVLHRRSLSDRELEVAALAAAGLSNRAIADRLFLSPRTVEKHVEHVMDKLGVGSRAEIAAWHAREVARCEVEPLPR